MMCGESRMQHNVLSLLQLLTRTHRSSKWLGSGGKLGFEGPAKPVAGTGTGAQGAHAQESRSDPRDE